MLLLITSVTIFGLSVLISLWLFSNASTRFALRISKIFKTRLFTTIEGNMCDTTKRSMIDSFNGVKNMRDYFSLIPNIYGIIPHFYYEPITDTKEYLNKNTYFRPIINKIIRLGIENEKLPLYKNKMCFRDYLHIYDLITALLVAGVTDGERKYYTLGCDNRSTIEDVWNIIAQNLGGIPIEYDDSRKLSDMETRSFTSDYTEFRALTGWNAKYTIRYGIRETVEQIKRVLKDDSTF